MILESGTRSRDLLTNSDVKVYLISAQELCVKKQKHFLSKAQLVLDRTVQNCHRCKAFNLRNNFINCSYFCKAWGPCHLTQEILPYGAACPSTALAKVVACRHHPTAPPISRCWKAWCFSPTSRLKTIRKTQRSNSLS